MTDIEDVWDPSVDTPLGLLRTLLRQNETLGKDPDNLIEKFGKFIRPLETSSDKEISPLPFEKNGNTIVKPVEFILKGGKIRSLYEFPNLAFTLFYPLVSTGREVSNLYEYGSLLSTQITRYSGRIRSVETKDPDILAKNREISKKLDRSYILLPMIIGLKRKNQAIRRIVNEDFAFGVDPIRSPYMDIIHVDKGIVYTIDKGKHYVYDRPGSMKTLERFDYWTPSKSEELQTLLGSSKLSVNDLIKRPIHTTGDIFGIETSSGRHIRRSVRRKLKTKSKTTQKQTKRRSHKHH